MRSLMTLAVAAAVLVGCSATPSQQVASPEPTHPAPPVSSGSSEPPRADPTPAITAAGQYRPLPLDAYRFSPEQSNLYQQAVRILRNQCLAQYGFQPYPDPPVFTGTEKYLRPTVTLDGYGIQSTPEDLAFEKAQQEYDVQYDKNPPSAAYLLVDQGTEKRSGIDPPSGGASKTVNGKKVYPTGCTGWAQDQISTKDRSEGQPRQLRPIYDAAWAAYEADPALAALNKAWSACMKTQGYKFADPLAAQQGAQPPIHKPVDGKAPVAPATGDGHTDAEKAIARADLTCRAQTSYDDKDHDLLAGHQRDLIEQNATVLEELQHDLADELRAAAAVIAGSSPSPSAP